MNVITLELTRFVCCEQLIWHVTVTFWINIAKLTGKITILSLFINKYTAKRSHFT